MSAPLDALGHDLAHLRQALDEEDFHRAGEVLAAHDRHLRRFVDDVGQQSPLQALRGLLRLQHRLAGCPNPEPGP